MSVDEIEKAVANLTREERARILARIEELDSDKWDRQIEADAKSGKLDKPFENAMDDFKNGRTTRL